MKTRLSCLLLASLIASARAEDIKTLTGAEYKIATISRAEPDGSW